MQVSPSNHRCPPLTTVPPPTYVSARRTALGTNQSEKWTVHGTDPGWALWDVFLQTLMTLVMPSDKGHQFLKQGLLLPCLFFLNMWCHRCQAAKYISLWFPKTRLATEHLVTPKIYLIVFDLEKEWMPSAMIISALVSRPTLRINAGEKIEVIQAPTHWAPTKEEE